MAILIGSTGGTQASMDWPVTEPVAGASATPTVKSLVTQQAGVSDSLDTLTLRSGFSLNDSVLSIDATTIRGQSWSFARSEMDWLAFEDTILRQPKPSSRQTDAVLLEDGRWLLGKVLQFDGIAVRIQDAAIRDVPLDEVAAIAFCETCQVAPPAGGLPGGYSQLGVGPTPGLDASALATGPDTCAGDEQFSFAPSNPRIGSELLIAVTSATRHGFPRLTGTESPSFYRARTGQLGYVWEWTLSPSWAGSHKFTFYVDSTMECANASVRVQQPLATSTPKVTSTPKTPTSTPFVTPVVGTPVPGSACSSYVSHAAAQAALRANPADPLNIDKSRNGVACEGADGGGFMNPPFDTVPVPRI